MTSKRILSAVIAAALALSAASLSGCQLKGHSPEDYYVSPLATHDTAEQSDTSASDEESSLSDTESEKAESKKEESKAESKAESKKEESKAESKKAESKAESKKAESKAESKKTESKAESKKTESKKTESKKAESKLPEGAVESRTESKAESKKEEASSEKKDKNEDSKIYKDMVSLIKDEDVLGYTVTKLPGSDADHLIIYYGQHIKKEDTDTSNLIILDSEGYAKELEEKENDRREQEESTKLYSVYKISGDRCTPEGDIDGYFTTAYLSPNTNTIGLYYNKGENWKYGLIEISGSSAVINYTYEGNLEDNGGSLPPMPGNEIKFSKPDNYDLIKKYK